MTSFGLRIRGQKSVPHPTCPSHSLLSPVRRSPQHIFRDLDAIICYLLSESLDPVQEKIPEGNDEIDELRHIFKKGLT